VDKSSPSPIFIFIAFEDGESLIVAMVCRHTQFYHSLFEEASPVPSMADLMNSLMLIKYFLTPLKQLIWN
jgi:hypothetical protein